jgi:mRNA interferase YafQ
MRTIERSTQFKKDYKKYSKSVYGSELDARLKDVIALLLVDQPLPIRFRDHQLRGTEVVRLVRLGLALVAIRWWCWMVAQVASPQPIASNARCYPDHRPRQPGCGGYQRVSRHSDPARL